MRVVAVVQARIASSRLPAKILLDLGGKTALERALTRARRVRGVEEVVLAVPDTQDDEILVLMARRLGVRAVRGSETDVLARYHRAATEARAEAVVRFTSDCPLLDPAVSSRVVEGFVAERGALDYASNVLERKLPRGLDTEIMSFEALDRAHRAASDAASREHVTRHLYTRPEEFRCKSILPPLAQDLSSHRWTLDTVDDYRFLFEVFEALGPGADDAGMAEVLELLGRAPHLTQINAHIAQKTA